MNVMTTSVNNISRLPEQCKHGYIVTVSNSAEAGDDYYHQFKATYPAVDGAGFWEERPNGLKNELNQSSMPTRWFVKPMAFLVQLLALSHDW